MHSQRAILEALFRGADVTRFGMQDLVDRAAQLRGRPIRLKGMAMSEPDMWGLWFAGPRIDHILYECRTPPIHRLHCVAHELSHMLLGHAPTPIDGPLPAVTPALARQANRLHRSPNEVAAERLAAEIQYTLLDRVGMQALTREIATAPMWRQLVEPLGLDR